MSIINRIQSHTFTNKNIQKHSDLFNLLYHSYQNVNINRTMNNKTNKHTTTPHINVKNNKQVYVENDNSIWFIFIMKNGIQEYNLLKKKHTIESKFRYSLIDVIQDNKKLLKANKVRVDDVVNDIGNLGNITLTTLKAIAICMKMNLCIKKNKVCQICKNNDSNDYYIIEGSKMKIDEVSHEYIKNNYYEVVNIDKPFKSISSYKLADLKEICDKLELLTLEDKNEGKKLKKTDYYMKIMEHVS